MSLKSKKLEKKVSCFLMIVRRHTAGDLAVLPGNFMLLSPFVFKKRHIAKQQILAVVDNVLFVKPSFKVGSSCKMLVLLLPLLPPMFFQAMEYCQNHKTIS